MRIISAFTQVNPLKSWAGRFQMHFSCQMFCSAMTSWPHSNLFLNAAMCASVRLSVCCLLFACACVCWNWWFVLAANPKIEIQGNFNWLKVVNGCRIKKRTGICNIHYPLTILIKSFFLLETLNRRSKRETKVFFWLRSSTLKFTMYL